MLGTRTRLRIGHIRTLDSLRAGGFRVFWLSMLAQWAAFAMQSVANGWFLYELTDSPFLLGLMGAAQGLPQAAFAVFGGALADRLEKRRLLFFGALFQGLTMGVVALLVMTGAVAWWHLLIASAFQGTLFGLTIPARQSAVPQLVGTARLVNAMSLNNAGMNVTSLIGPALAGFLLIPLGVTGVYWMITSLALLSAVVMLKVPDLPPVQNGRRRTGLFGDVWEGLRYSINNRVLMLLLILSLVSVSFAMPLNNLLPVFAKDVLGHGPSSLGLLMSMGGVGALVGSVVIASLADVRRKGLVLLLMITLWGGAVVLFAGAHAFALALTAMVLVGLGQSGRNVLVNTLMLTRAPDAVRGRVISLSMMTWGLQPLGVLPIGAAAQAIGAPWAVGIGGMVVVAMALGMLAFSPKLRGL